MVGKHTYQHLDKDSQLEVHIQLSDVAEKIIAMNYGVQRFLSHLVDMRRKAHVERINSYVTRGYPDVAQQLEVEGDRLAEGINKLLEQSLF